MVGLRAHHVCWYRIVEEMRIQCTLAPPELRSPAEGVEGLAVWILPVRGLVSVNPQGDDTPLEVHDVFERVMFKSWVPSQRRSIPEPFEMLSPAADLPAEVY